MKKEQKIYYSNESFNPTPLKETAFTWRLPEEVCIMLRAYGVINFHSDEFGEIEVKLKSNQTK